MSISVIITTTLVMMTEMDIETSVYNVHLTRLIAREDFIKRRQTSMPRAGFQTATPMF
jgi:hypothetical protein